jgi:hypothetical protein
MEHAWTAVDWMGLLAMVITVVGTVCLAKPKLARYGWTTRACGDLLWVIWSFLIGYVSVMMNFLLFLAVDLYALKTRKGSASKPTDLTNGEMSPASESPVPVGVPAAGKGKILVTDLMETTKDSDES